MCNLPLPSPLALSRHSDHRCDQSIKSQLRLLNEALLFSRSHPETAETVHKVFNFVLAIHIEFEIVLTPCTVTITIS